MLLATRISLIRPSATLSINAKALALKAQGLNIISLALGEPDFDTPEHICVAAKEAIDAGFTKYTAVPGFPALRGAVAALFETRYGIKVKPNNTIVTNGAKQALYNLFLSLLNPGDEVLLPAPYWVSYPDIITLAEGVTVPVPANASKNFKITVEDLEKHRTPKTRILLFNSPSNPTGVVYTKEEMDQITAWAIEKGLFIISDEIYDQIVYDGLKPVSLTSWWARYPEQIAIVNGFAKAYAMPGWRVGFVLAHEALIEAMSEIQGQTTANICSISQKAALAALTGPQDCIVTMRNAFEHRRNFALKEIATWPNVICPKPQGAFYLFLDVSALYTPAIPDAAAMCAMLLEKAHVALVPGCAFGDPSCIRLSYVTADEVLMNALKAMHRELFT